MRLKLTVSHPLLLAFKRSQEWLAMDAVWPLGSIFMYLEGYQHIGTISLLAWYAIDLFMEELVVVPQIVIKKGPWMTPDNNK